MPSSRVASKDTTEAAILGRILANGNEPMPLDLAKYLLRLGFSEEEKTRMHELAVKNQEGRASAEELRVLDGYIRVGDFLAILQSKARKATRARSK